MARNNSNANPNSAGNAAAANSGPRVVPVVFLHPREGSEFAADIGPTTTGQAAIEGLVQERFIPAPTDTVTYALQLQRTGKSIPLSELLLSIGVTANDRIAIVATQAAA